MQAQQLCIEKSFCQAYYTGYCYMQIKLQATKKFTYPVGNPYKSIDITSIFDFIILFVRLSADNMWCYTQIKPKNNSKTETRILI